MIRIRDCTQVYHNNLVVKLKVPFYFNIQVEFCDKIKF
jgi:hypothetical protein